MCDAQNLQPLQNSLILIPPPHILNWHKFCTNQVILKVFLVNNKTVGRTTPATLGLLKMSR